MRRKVKLLLPTLVLAAALPVFIMDPISEKKLAGVGNAFEEIYEDRLVVESYIYNLNDALYQARLLFMSGSTDAHQSALLGNKIRELTGRYAQTKLTKDEAAGFRSFMGDAQPLIEHLVKKRSGMTEAMLISRTDDCLSSLHQLSLIQLHEGRMLQVESRKTLSSSLLSLKADWISFVLMLIAILVLLRERVLKPTKVTHMSLN